MTTYLKYYRRENERHQAAEKVKGDFNLALSMTKVLFGHFKVPSITVKLFDRSAKQFRRMRKVKSWFQPGGIFRKAEIVYHPSMLSALTVAHEVAHYVDDYRAKQAKRRRGRWHSVAHRKLTDQAVEALKTHPKFQAFFTGEAKPVVPKTEVDPTAAAQLINEFYNKLPEKLTCPCCNATIPKLNFGVRVMKKDAQGLPLVIRRQSYCKACR